MSRPEYSLSFCFLNWALEISIRRSALANMNLNGPSLPWAKNSIDQVLQSPRDSLPQSPLAVDTCAQQRAKLSIITDLVSPRQTPLQWIDSPDRKHYSSPIAQYCTGFCRDNLHMYSHQQVLKADVVRLPLLSCLLQYADRVSRYRFRLQTIARCHGRIRMGSP